MTGAWRPGPATTCGGSSPAAYGPSVVNAIRTSRSPCTAAPNTPPSESCDVDSDTTTSGASPGGGSSATSVLSQCNGPTSTASGGQSDRGGSSAGNVATSRRTGGTRRGGNWM